MPLFKGKKKSASEPAPDLKQDRKISKKEKKKASDLTVLIDETQPDAILSELRDNRNMIIGGRYAAIMLDNNALPEDLKLSKKNRKSEAIGSFLSAINKDQISAVGLPSLLKDNRLVIIPNYVTLDNLDSFVDFRNPKLYPFTYVLIDDGLNVENTGIPADFPTLEAIVSGDDGPDNATLEYALGVHKPEPSVRTADEMPVQTPGRQSFVFDQMSPDVSSPAPAPEQALPADYGPASMPSHENASAPREDEDDEEEAVFIPEDETFTPDDFSAQDQDLHEESLNDSRPLDPNAVYDQDYPENLSDFQNEDEFDPYGHDAPFPGEPFHDADLPQSFTELSNTDSYAAEDESESLNPDAVLSTIGIDATPIQFRIENLDEIEDSKPLQFDLLSEDDWYASAMNNTIRRYNSDLSSLHQANMQQLTGARNTILQELQKALAEEYDITSPDTEYGRMFADLEAEKEQALENVDTVASSKKQQIREEYERQLQEAQNLAARQAKTDFESRNLHRFNRELERVDSEARKQIEFEFESRRNDLQNRMTDEIQQSISSEISDINQKSFKMWKTLLHKEKQMFDDFSVRLNSLQTSLQDQNSQRIQLERDSLQNSSELKKLNTVYSAKLQASQAEYEHQMNVLKDSFSTAQTAWKSRQEESEQKYQTLLSQLEDSKKTISELEKSGLEVRRQIEKEVSDKFRDELEEAKKERDKIEESYKNIEKTQKKINSTGIMISAVVAVLAITIGIIIGMLINFKTSTPAAQPQNTGQSTYVLPHGKTADASAVSADR